MRSGREFQTEEPQPEKPRSLFIMHFQNGSFRSQWNAEKHNHLSLCSQWTQRLRRRLPLYIREKCKGAGRDGLRISVQLTGLSPANSPFVRLQLWAEDSQHQQRLRAVLTELLVEQVHVQAKVHAARQVLGVRWHPRDDLKQCNQGVVEIVLPKLTVKDTIWFILCNTLLYWGRFRMKDSQSSACSK